MQPETPKPEVNVRTYFLQQGQSIAKLNELLDSSLLSGSLKRGISILLEIIFLLVFLAFLLIAVYIPMDPMQFSGTLSEETTVSTRLHNDDVDQRCRIYRVPHSSSVDVASSQKQKKERTDTLRIFGSTGNENTF